MKFFKKEIYLCCLLIFLMFFFKFRSVLLNLLQYKEVVVGASEFPSKIKWPLPQSRDPEGGNMVLRQAQERVYKPGFLMSHCPQKEVAF